MAPFGVLAAVASALLASSPPSPARRLEVCLSPGCVADGAEPALRRLRALAPPCVRVSPGKCASACGAGPVVIEPTDKANVVHKRVKDDALLKLLMAVGEEEVEELSPAPDLIKGYDLCLEAGQSASDGDNEAAVRLYAEGIALSIDAAVANAAVANAADEGNGPDEAFPLTPSCLEWVVEAHRGLALARLETKDMDGALEAAKTACDLSRKTDPLCWEGLAGVCQAMGDNEGELEALQKLFALPQEESPPRDVANRMRSLGFRLAKLEREASN